jgi:hypothetical protein
MTEHLRRPAALMALAMLAFVSAVFAAACGGNDGDAGSDQATVAAISIMDASGLHEVHETIVLDKTIPATARTTALRLETLARLTDWPTDDLDKQALALAGLLRDMSHALDSDTPDMARVEETAGKAHTAWHEFSQSVWGYLYEAGGVHHDSAGAEHAH